MGFTPKKSCEAQAYIPTPTINHARAPFTENKRYRKKPR
jgi:hypothetical protein